MIITAPLITGIATPDGVAVAGISRQPSNAVPVHLPDHAYSVIYAAPAEPSTPHGSFRADVVASRVFGGLLFSIGGFIWVAVSGEHQYLPAVIWAAASLTVIFWSGPVVNSAWLRYVITCCVLAARESLPPRTLRFLTAAAGAGLLQAQDAARRSGRASYSWRSFDWDVTALPGMPLRVAHRGPVALLVWQVLQQCRHRIVLRSVVGQPDPRPQPGAVPHRDKNVRLLTVRTPLRSPARPWPYGTSAIVNPFGGITHR